MTLDWREGGLAAGLQCYERGEFFETHEHWEGVWLACEGAEKAFLQALIQVTVAFHHLQKKNALGAESLLRRALRRLESYPAEFGGVDVERIRENLRAWIDSLGKSQSHDKLLYPRISAGSF
ncbi:MAG TPA: DUF309 domain-containing protein [Terracidiphilus sp.]|jgi:predicted metal-dependent hydrolase|nr:DUF309 domain-containing protein [Terracidiphilus sp.]